MPSWLPETCGRRSMPAEEVAVFLTSNPHLLNRTGKRAWRRAGIRPLRRSAPVSGINKTAEGRKHTTLAVWRAGRGCIKGCYMDENGLYLRLSSNWSIHLPSHLWHRSYCLCKTRALFKFRLWLSPNADHLIYICVTDPCRTHSWRIIWGGCEVTEITHRFLLYLTLLLNCSSSTSSSAPWVLRSPRCTAQASCGCSMSLPAAVIT